MILLEEPGEVGRIAVAPGTGGVGDRLCLAAFEKDCGPLGPNGLDECPDRKTCLRPEVPLEREALRRTSSAGSLTPNPESSGFCSRTTFLACCTKPSASPAIPSWASDPSDELAVPMPSRLSHPEAEGPGQASETPQGGVREPPSATHSVPVIRSAKECIQILPD